MPAPGSLRSTERRGFVGTALAALGAIFSRSEGVVAGEATPPQRPMRIGRRIVTGVDRQGRSRIDTTAPPAENATWNDDGTHGMDLWVVRQVPARLDTGLEPHADWQPSKRAPMGGIVGRLMTWPSGFEYSIHTTPTIDLGVIVSGRLELILDEGSTILNPGDVLVQRGTAHGWRVVGPEPCTWVVVMIDAQPMP